MKITSPLEEALRHFTNSINIFKLFPMSNTQGMILNVSSTGERQSKYLINSSSCGQPPISDNFTVLSLLSAESERHPFSQKSKSGASAAMGMFDEPCQSQMHKIMQQLILHTQV
ncbi:hypothetical protein V8G54_016641 [Vigna mungo]|uniref:Uncharacterized protein n=1 Tax=Vigna mungo TaxID=3915 RepID=A0AAQ3NNG8_VIGMU